jgi:hypothetical protein
MAGLTNMPSVWGDLQLPGVGNAASNQEMLSEQEKIARKKKIMSAGNIGNNMQSATQLMFGGGSLPQG